ncbi:MAG: ribosome silencing factor [Propionibacteriaceae bacterium]|jgi:ribosome-associated protein|nr:ribosome silencing factor [Propionibacteriaceae bacterium]
MSAGISAIQITQIAAQAASDKLAGNLIAFDVAQRLALADVFLIATGANERQVNAIVDNVEEQLLRVGVKAARREGGANAAWVLLDYLDVVVHVQNPQARELYSLDRLWRDCPQVELQITEHEFAQASS